MKTLISIIFILLAQQVAAAEVNITLGISTPLGGSQDIYKSDKTQWQTGDAIGSINLSTPCGYVNCNLWHHSIITDTRDYGVTGIGVTKTWRINW